MTLEELKKKIYDFNIPESWYSLNDGLKPMAHIVYKNYSKWEYFYIDERGGRCDYNFFVSQEEAFDYLWEALKNDAIIFKINPQPS